MTVPHCFPAAGTVRASDKRINSLYKKANKYIEQPILWEGLFKVACLIKNRPIDEPVTSRIINAYSATENGAFNGRLSEQICIARSSLAVFEYNTDKLILVRLSAWLRYIEEEYDRLIIQDGVLYKPADLMEFLLRYYFITGSKCALRLCSKLRSDAFDWTTALHTFQRSIPIKYAGEQKKYSLPETKPDKLDYDEKEKLINHSELLADGIRYTLFAGLFSGHSMDISAGKTAWAYLIKHHHALCGGVTGNPFLSGDAADQIINNCSIAAWAEAFAAQMILPDFGWAADELIRIIYNGFDECLNNENISVTQRINTICETNDTITDPSQLYARLTRTVSIIYSHAITLKQKGIRINYLLPGKYMLMLSGQKVLLKTDYEKVVIKTNTCFSDLIEVFSSSSETGLYKRIRKDEKDEIFNKVQHDKNACFCISDAVKWHDQDIIQFCPDENVICEKTHHQGAAFMYCNRLMCMPVNGEDYARAVCDMPLYSEKRITVTTAATDKWKSRRGQPDDIPVLPVITENIVRTELIPYSACKRRITMFPRAR